MLKENQTVVTSWNPFTKKYYESKGYVYTHTGDPLEVRVEDLPPKSGVMVKVICDFCGKEIEKRFKDYTSQHEGGDCCLECEGKKSLASTERKHGVGFRGDTLKKISLAKYGVENAMKSEEVKKKVAKTNQEKYGVESTLNLLDHREIGKKSWSEESRTKRINTNIEKYGYSSPLSSPLIREKINSTLSDNGNVKTSSQQQKIFDMLKTQYDFCKLNFPCGQCFLDCVVQIRDIKIDIEYDGQYWHQDEQKDRRRDEYVKSQGYKILRISSKQKIPTLEQLKDEISILVNTDKKFERMVLN